MQIHEITKSLLKEGFFTNVGRGLVQGVTGVNLPQAQLKIDPATLQSTQATLTPTNERIVVTLSQPGQTVPAKYYKTNNVWTNELGNVITDPRQTSYLEKLVPTHGTKETISVPQPTRKVSRQRVSRDRPAKTK